MRARTCGVASGEFVFVHEDGNKRESVFVVVVV